MSKIIILGDLFPNNVSNFPKITENDFCIANLECAITNNGVPVKKDGPHLKIDFSEAKFIKNLGINLVGLANNHTMDYGIKGFNDTLSFLDSNGIKHAGGVGDDHFHIENIENKKVCFYFVSEHQYNTSKNVGGSVNVIDNQKTFKEISNLKAKCDYLIVCFHGGKEYYPFPTPLQQLTCHTFVDSGADFVVCQHSHCVGCKETYKDSDIIYGQGNFAFPYRDNEHFKTGIITELTLDEKNQSSLAFIPIVHKERETIRYANEEEKKNILENFERNSSLLAEKHSEALYDDMVSKCGLDFLYRLFNKNKLYVRLDTSRFFKNRMLKRYIAKNQKFLLYLYNYFNCETHTEYIKAILLNQIKNEVK